MAVASGTLTWLAAAYTRGGRAGLALLGVWTAGLMVAGVFPADPPGAWAVKQKRLSRDHGHLAMMDASMNYLRQCAPAVLAAVRFAGGPGTELLLFR